MHAVAQQTPSMQWPFAHCPSAVQEVPLAEPAGASVPSSAIGASGTEVVPPVELGASGDATPPEPPTMPPPPAPPAPPLLCEPSTGLPPAPSVDPMRSEPIPSNPAFPSSPGDTYLSALPPSRPTGPRTQCP